MQAASVIKEYRSLEADAAILSRELEQAENALRGGVGTEADRDAVRKRLLDARLRLKQREAAFKQAMEPPPQPSREQQVKRVVDMRRWREELRTEDQNLADQHERLIDAVKQAETDLKEAQDAFTDQRRAALGRGAKAAPDLRTDAEARLKTARDDLDAVTRGRNDLKHELLGAVNAVRDSERTLASMSEREALERLATDLAALDDNLNLVLTARQLKDPRLGESPATKSAAKELGLVVVPLGPGRWQVTFNAPVGDTDGLAWLEAQLKAGGSP